MQRDTDFVIGDIFFKLPREKQSLDLIFESKALLETHKDLCFLEIPPDPPHKLHRHGFTCKLSKKGEHRGETDYLAVSYCWDSFDNSDSSVPSPSAVKVDDDGKIRNPKCPPDVLRRAATFAVDQGLSLVWIDQECVDQSSPADVQNHLQCNDSIFQQAKLKAGLLNFKLTSQRQVSGIWQLRKGKVLDSLCYEAINEKRWDLVQYRLQYGTRLLKAISRDRFFKRTWVFQERVSSEGNMYYLLPASREVIRKLPQGFDYQPVGADFPIPEHNLVYSALYWKNLVSTNASLKEQLSADRDLRAVVRVWLDAYHEAANSLSNPIYQSLGSAWDLVGDNLEPSGWLSTPAAFSPSKYFSVMEGCDNRIFSDRLAILSNLAKFKMRISPSGLESYSFALLLLLVKNEAFPEVIVARSENCRPDFFSRPISALDLVEIAHSRMKLAGKDELAARAEIDTIIKLLGSFSILIDESLISQENFDQVQEKLGESTSAMLKNMKLESIHRSYIVPTFLTVGNMMENIFLDQHPDCFGLLQSHGEALVQYARMADQLEEGDKFLSFGKRYRWGLKFIKHHFI